MNEVDVPLPALSPNETAALAEYEIVIERGMGVFVEVGAALMAVRDMRLYRADFGTFEDYCSERWSMERAHAYRLIDSAQVVREILSPIGDEINNEDVPVPATESQARELAPLLDQPDELREAWSKAVERTGGKPTAAAIRDIVREATEEAEAEVAETERQREVNAELSAIAERNPEKFRDDLGVEITWPVIRALEKLLDLPAPVDVAAHWPSHLRDRLDLVIGPAHQWLADLHKQWAEGK